MLLEFLRIIMLHFYVVVKYCKLAQSYYAEKLQLSVVSVEDPCTKIPRYAASSGGRYVNDTLTKEQLLGG